MCMCTMQRNNNSMFTATLIYLSEPGGGGGGTHKDFLNMSYAPRFCVIKQSKIKKSVVHKSGIFYFSGIFYPEQFHFQ